MPGAPEPPVIDAAQVRARYEQAVNQWAYSILEMPSMNGISMGVVFELGSLLGITAPEIAADMQAAKALIEAEQTRERYRTA